MAWECAECGHREDRHVRVDAVCHHCGKLLCRDDRVEIADLAFAGTPGPIPRTAIHCRRCKQRHHVPDIPLSGERR